MNDEETTAKPRMRSEAGEGSIRYRPTDERWEARISLGYARGKRATKSFFGHTRDEVEKKLERAKERVAKGQPILRDKRRIRRARYAKPPEIFGAIAVVSELTEVVQQRIVDAVSIGLHPEQAAVLAGVPAKLYKQWTELADDGIERYAALMHMISVAEVRHEARLVHVVDQAAIDNPKFALKVLALRYPSRWSEQDDVHPLIAQSFSINIHLNRNGEEEGYVDTDSQPLSMSYPSRLPPDYRAPAVHATPSTNPAHSVAVTPALPDPRGERERDPLQSPPGYFKPRKPYDDPDSTLN